MATIEPSPGDFPARMADSIDSMKNDVTMLKTAVFGNPLDVNDTGMVGALRDIREHVTNGVSKRMERFYIALLGFAGTCIIVIATLAAGHL